MLQMSEHAGAMLIFSSRKLVTLLDSSVGRLDHPLYYIHINTSMIKIDSILSYIHRFGHSMGHPFS